MTIDPFEAEEIQKAANAFLNGIAAEGDVEEEASGTEVVVEEVVEEETEKPTETEETSDETEKPEESPIAGDEKKDGDAEEEPVDKKKGESEDAYNYRKAMEEVVSLSQEEDVEEVVEGEERQVLSDEAASNSIEKEWARQFTSFPLSQQQFDDSMEKPEAFVQNIVQPLLSQVMGTMQRIIAAIPPVVQQSNNGMLDIVMNAVEEKFAYADFASENSDLAGFDKLIKLVKENVRKKNPKISHSDLYTEVGKEVRKRLNMPVSGAVVGDATDRPGRKVAGVVKPKKSRVPTKATVTGDQSIIRNLISH